MPGCKGPPPPEMQLPVAWLQHAHGARLQIILILHMDHEQNASTSTVRTAGELACLLLSPAGAAELVRLLYSRDVLLGPAAPCCSSASLSQQVRRAEVRS